MEPHLLRYSTAVAAYVRTAQPDDAMRVLHYGGGLSRKVVYMLYTGQHYDPLVGPGTEGRRSFPSRQEAPKSAAACEAAALAIAEEHKDAEALLAVERSLPAGSINSPSPGGRRQLAPGI